MPWSAGWVSSSTRSSTAGAPTGWCGGCGAWPERPRGARSADEAEADADQHADGLHAVAPGELLALRPAAGVVGDGHLEDPVPGAQDLAGHLGLDAEAVRL